ncbi:MAG TPA: glycoside hydrolase family 2 TIM barrel-domain containing protein [Bryobacteraceae bacterium]|nr:glycoside hydrolase family 2 TIM barrel-domain containing protein [Bryobacteraceae bacterium]
MRVLRYLASFAAAAAFCGACHAEGPRAEIAFNTDWKFFRGDPQGASAVPFADSAWAPVTLPHTWNDKDALPGPGMYQGPGWYRKQFAASADWKGRRVFVRFGAASLAAEVYLNGVKIGSHEGGFAAFCFEITQQLRFDAKNIMAVRVDNTRGKIAPLAGDFTVFGGLYRPVNLIVTNTLDITPLDYAGPGVYFKQLTATIDMAQVEVLAKVSNSSNSTRFFIAQITVLDERGKTVDVSRVSGAVNSGGEQDLKQTIALRKPRLWNGVRDPYFYTGRLDLIENGKRVDSVEQPMGVRDFHVDPKNGDLLNGQPFQIHGVCLHQDGANGWAVTDKDEDGDMAILRDMGVNAVRLAHYQHSDHFLSLCDRYGIAAWSELALVNDVHYTPEFRQNLRQQLTEMIRQNFNHPSILVWSVYNEISSRTEQPAAMVKEVADLARAEDPTRPVTGAASTDTAQNLPDAIHPLDLIAVNLYDGWYGGKPADLGADLDKYNAKYGSRGLALSEYGAGASIHQHQEGMTAPPSPGGKFHPEEWQAIVHETQWPLIAARPYVWGSFAWVMFDFASAGRHEGDTDGINDKGLVTRDRQTKKDAFYYYKANWNPEPMIYITGRRNDPRSTPTIAVKLYSNCEKVTLKVNGKSLGELTPSAPHVYIKDGVTLSAGPNIMEAEGTSPGKVARDVVTWNYRAGEPPAAPKGR